MEDATGSAAGAGEKTAVGGDPDVHIRRCSPEDEEALFALMKREGDDWKGYWDGAGRAKYRAALHSSLTWLLFESGRLCGFARCRRDDGFGVYVYDLLVDRASRGKEYGRLLMEQVCRDYPDEPTYVMSDVDPYYEKLGYQKEGTIFIVGIK